MSNLLIELLVEELPPKALKLLGLSFAKVLAESLQSQGLSNVDSMVTNFATPRRLAAHITNVVAKAADEQVAQKLMPVKVGLDAQGKATPALLKRLDGMGLDASAVAKLRTENDGKTDNLFLDMSKTGATLSEGLQKAIEEALAKLPIPKVMSYQINDGWETVNFVRPAHCLIALHGSDVIPVSVLGLSANNTTTGHRFESKKAVITINDADSYEQQLNAEGAVIASFDARKADIANQLKAAADKEGLSAIEDDDLLDEVTALVELPNVLLGQYETEFLEVPQECLVLTMKSNQKYFPLLDSNGKLTSKFLIVSNIHPADPSAVIGGNERVVRPRLADAKFFFDQDRKKTLGRRIANLDKVVYHNKLGSQGERNLRVVKLAGAIAKQLGNEDLVTKAEQAARLSKADLMTYMVNEFPELQGIMGRYYAQHEGLDDAVAFAIEDHYKPRFAGDELPRSQVGICVALADKLETLVGLFSIGEKPTGDKDPFALRRQALGIIRMLIDAKLPLSFDSLIQLALQQFDGNVEVLASIKSFCFDRLSVNLKDQGASAQEVDAVLSLAPALLHEIPQRLAAVQTFSTLAEAPALAAANKRVGNILRKVEGEVAAKVDKNLLQEATEKALAAALNTSKAEADKLFEAGDYTGSLQALAVLKAPVDDFFDNVMVNADDPALKANRLGLLATLHQAMNRVADLSKLAS
ncbi:MAG: glycine--tRNA ligase subunit beta [Methylophilaceae bacterium]|nr:glycine--tRNA ligase subunit beta [Methylophilaceae bacterium]